MTILPSIYQKLLVLFLGSVLFHSLTRLTFFLWNQSFYQQTPWVEILGGFLWGLRFDISASAAILAPLLILSLFIGYWLPRRLFNWLCFIGFTSLFLPFIAINFIDIEMIHFAGRRFSFDTLFMFREVEGKAQAYFKDYGAMIVFVFLLLVAVGWLIYNWLFKWSEQKAPAKFRGLLSHGVTGLVFIILSVIAIRGGLQLKPIGFVHSQIYSSSWVNSLIMNSSFSIIKSVGQEQIQDYGFFSSDSEREQWLNSALPGPSLVKDRPLAPKTNVVLIILESFNFEYMGRPHGGHGYTPFLDELAAKSLFFTGAIANGRRSIEGVPAILTGVPTLMDEPFITSPFAGNEILKLPEILKEQGYHTSFFHGGANGTMYFDSFAQGVGFDHYYGLNEYPHPQDHDGTWGIFDEPFFQFFAQHLNQFPQPFFSTIFTLTSHQPYQIPPQYRNQFPEGPIAILQAIGYTDYSLMKFFAKAAEAPWYKNTLFVITADHTHMSYRDEYRNDLSSYRVPLLLFSPSYDWPHLDTQQIVQQIDIPLTILDLLGLESPKKAPLNVSAFVPGDKSAATYLDGRFFLIAKDYYLTWVPGQNPKMYSRQDLAQEKALEEPKNRKDVLVNRLKAQLDFYNRGLLENKLLEPQ